MANQLSIGKEKENMEKKTQATKRNCINKPGYPLSNQCQITNIIYKVKVTSNLRNLHEKIYYGTSEGTFKQRYGNHKKSFNHEKHWRLKELKARPQVQFYILKKMRTNRKNRYLLFMFERETSYR